jgi:SAM-dependent methyltransferase
MPADGPAGADHWPENARSWSSLGPPLRPSPDDTRIVEAAISQWHQRNAAAAPRALLLGATPEIAACDWPAGTRLVAMDRNSAVIAMLWPAPGTPAGALAICADWRAMPLDTATVDIVVGDGCHVCARFPDEALAINREVHRILRPGGMVVIRVFLRPDSRESLADIRHDLENGAVGSIHALKWRIAAALHDSTAEGVRLADIWSAWDELRPLAEREAERREWRPGWQPGELATLDIHRGLETRFCMPKLGDFRATICDLFFERHSAIGGYELADRCRTFVLEKR